MNEFEKSFQPRINFVTDKNVNYSIFFIDKLSSIVYRIYMGLIMICRFTCPDRVTIPCERFAKF
jgi:hypothetical protein